MTANQALSDVEWLVRKAAITHTVQSQLSMRTSRWLYPICRYLHINYDIDELLFERCSVVLLCQSLDVSTFLC